MTKGWVAVRGPIQAFKPGRALFGLLTLSKGSWGLAYAAVTATQLHLFYSSDSTTSPADVSLALEDVYVDDAPADAPPTVPPHAFGVHSRTGVVAWLAADSFAELVTWVTTIRHGSAAYRTAAQEVSHLSCCLWASALVLTCTKRQRLVAWAGVGGGGETAVL